jgi:hypothetical protein
MTSIAALLAARLPAGLIHPGNPDANQPAQAIPMPGLSRTGIPPEMARQFASDAGLPSSDVTKLLAEAIVHLIETEGASTIIANTELDALRQAAAAAPEGTRAISVHCHCDNTRSMPLLMLTVGKGDHVSVNGGPLLRALARRNPDCPHEVI